MGKHQPKYGIAMRNFQTYPNMPDARKLIDYGVRMEEIGFESLWVWDHILLGVDPSFPIIDSLSLLTGVAARTSKIKLGTGVLVLPLRNPVVLAKQLSSMDHISQGRLVLGLASGWYKHEFNAVGIDFHKRGKIMEQNLEILTRLWTEDMVTGSYPPHELKRAVMFPHPYQKPHPPILIGGYVDAVLKRAALRGDGWLTYFYTAKDFADDWGKVRRFAEEGGRDPDTLTSANQIPIMVGEPEKAAPEMLEWLNTEWDFASWSKSSRESAIVGTVDECIEQVQAHIDTGVDRIIFVPYRYRDDQVDMIAEEILPKLSTL